MATELARVFHKMWPTSFQKGSESALRHGQRNRSFIYLGAVGAFGVGKDFRISKAEVCDHHNYNYVQCYKMTGSRLEQGTSYQLWPDKAGQFRQDACSKYFQSNVPGTEVPEPKNHESGLGRLSAPPPRVWHSADPSSKFWRAWDVGSRD